MSYNGFELSRPARTLASFSSFPFHNHLPQIAPSAGSAAAICYAGLNSESKF